MASRTSRMQSPSVRCDVQSSLESRAEVAPQAVAGSAFRIEQARVRVRGSPEQCVRVQRFASGAKKLQC
eukprot:3522884-Pleurochrysis_carterae.AAC.1